MKILLVGNYAPDAQHSMQLFCALLEAELGKAGHAVEVVRPGVRLGRFASAQRGVGKWLGYVDKFVLFPALLRGALERASDVVHICDQAYSAYTRYLRVVPHVVTCHDLIAVRSARGEIPEVGTKWSGRKYQDMIVNGLAQAGHVACGSQATRSDALRLCNLTPSRTSVVHNALNFSYRPVSEAERTARLSRLGIGVGDRFILHVGVCVWYKNQSGVIRIFGHLAASAQGRDLGLVMVSSGLAPGLGNLISKCGLQPRVRVLSDVEPEDLRALYSSATALLFPSLYEGFGWPIVEAQACGCPVFTSNRPPMTEVGGKGAVYIDPENPERAAATILENLTRAAQMREAGFANARRFSAEKMVAGYLRAYGEAMKVSSALGSKDTAEALREADSEAEPRETHPARLSL